MTFEETVRDRIKSYPYPAPEREVLKVVLGDLQLKSATAEFKDEHGHALVKKMIQANTENLAHLQTTDPRYAKYVLENEVLGALLPRYLNADEIRQSLESAGIDVLTPPAGKAIGSAMQHFKSQSIPVDGNDVKAVVASMRPSVGA